MVLTRDQTLADLRSGFTGPGHIDWLGVRPVTRGPMHAVARVELLADRGLEGDHRATRAGSRRQVTLIQAEHLALVAAWCGLTFLDPAWVRRNIVVSGINLLALRTCRFHLGETLLEGTGHCHPCSRMEAGLGTGGYNAMRGHGGITARVLTGGWIAQGDPVRFHGLPPTRDA